LASGRDHTKTHNQRRSHHRLRRAVGREDAPGRLEPVELGHADVHEHDVGLKRPRLLERFTAVRSLADHLDVLLRFQDHAKAAAQKRLVVGDEDADHRSLTATGSRARTM